MNDNMKNRLFDIIKHPLSYGFSFAARKGWLNFVPDKPYLHMQYIINRHNKLNLTNPKTFNEKVQWLKLYDRNPLYTMLVDKYEVKKYVSQKIGSQYVIPTLGVWNDFDDIDFNKLPKQFVLKCTHDSGGIAICSNRKEFDVKNARKKLTAHLRKNHYYWGREWAYKDVKPRIIAEKYMEETGYDGLKDYKIYNIWGQPQLIQVDFDRFVSHKRNLYTLDWEFLNKEIGFKSSSEYKFEKPECLDKILELAAVLSKDIPMVRTDFYCIDNKIYFGEMTFYPDGGIAQFRPDSFGFELGHPLDLSLITHEV